MYKETKQFLLEQQSLIHNVFNKDGIQKIPLL